MPEGQRRRQRNVQLLIWNLILKRRQAHRLQPRQRRYIPVQTGPANTLWHLRPCWWERPFIAADSLLFKGRERSRVGPNEALYWWRRHFRKQSAFMKWKLEAWREGGVDTGWRERGDIRFSTGLDHHLCVCVCVCTSVGVASQNLGVIPCCSLSCLQLHAKVLPGFKSGISQQCWGGHLANTTLNTPVHIATIQLFTLCWKCLSV